MTVPLKALPTPPAFRRHFTLVDRIGIGIGTPAPVYYRCIRSTETGHILQRVDQPDLTESFTHEQIAALEGREDWRFDRAWFDPKRAEGRLRSGVDRLAELPLEEFPDILWRYEVCSAFLAEETARRATRSDASMKAVLARITERATQLMLAHAGRTDKEVAIRATPHPKTVRGWLARFETSGHDPSSLRDHYRACGSLTPTLDAETQARVHQHALTFADAKRPSRRRCWENLRDDIRDLNEKRKAAGDSELPIPSQKTMDRAIATLNAFELDAARHGVDHARARFYIVQNGLEIIRPGERIEIDEWKISLQTLFNRAGLWWTLNQTHRDAIAGQRWHLSAARDVASQTYLAMRLAPTPTADLASETLRMIVTDKTPYATWAGCQSPWNMRCGLEQVVTDMGSAYTSNRYRASVLRLGGTVVTPPAGLPQLRADVERSFGTIRTRALSLYSGQTGANVLDRGDEDPRRFASLTIEDLAWSLVRFAVDCEHNRPSVTLNGETPARAWRRLTSLYGTVPPPDRDAVRNVFGTRVTRRLTQRGVRFHNVCYQSVALQEYRRQIGDCVIDIIIDTADLGWASVKIGDRGWLSVPCVHPGFDGYSLEEWIEVQADLRRRFAAEAAIDEHIVRKAMSDLRALSDHAFRRANLGRISITPAQIDAAEHALIIAWRPLSDSTGHQAPPDIFASAKPAADNAGDPSHASSPRTWSLD